MNRLLFSSTLSICILIFGCGENAPPAERSASTPDAAMAIEGETGENMLSGHMAAQAMLTAHFVAAAVKAGMSADEINSVLSSVADGSAISEFWVSDENGQVVFTNIPGADFAFPTDPESDAQAAPFARLLTGEQAVVDQEFMARDLDGKSFKYVGAAGVDQARIVQVGVAAAEETDAP